MSEIKDVLELFYHLLLDHDLIGQDVHGVVVGENRIEFQLDGWFSLWIDLPKKALAVPGKLVLNTYTDELRRYALDLMERVGEISLPADLTLMSQIEVYSVYMNWLKLMIKIAQNSRGVQA
ncbi:MAG: hypothetical protein H3C47_04160 [Candidatus Cloacimonetes bacterium]|nr:hypothetical protein [Candidatus Cloacimonadota bacterium]